MLIAERFFGFQSVVSGIFGQKIGGACGVDTWWMLLYVESEAKKSAAEEVARPRESRPHAFIDDAVASPQSVS